jgi:hypothetical protein
VEGEREARPAREPAPGGAVAGRNPSRPPDWEKETKTPLAGPAALRSSGTARGLEEQRHGGAAALHFDGRSGSARHGAAATQGDEERDDVFFLLCLVHDFFF